MAKMQSIEWVGAGVGAEVGAGVLTYLGGLASSTGGLALSVSFGVLPTALVGLGIIMIGYGLVKDFFLDNIETKMSVPATPPS